MPTQPQSSAQDNQTEDLNADELAKLIQDVPNRIFDRDLSRPRKSSGHVSLRKEIARLQKRWWFLTKDGFVKFCEDSLAQGYEVIHRHPEFPNSICAVNLGLRVPPPWSRLPQKMQTQFNVEFAPDLVRLGFGPFIALGPSAVTFNCIADAETIIAAIEHAFRRLMSMSRAMRLLFRASNPGESGRRRAWQKVNQKWLRLEIGPLNPEMVTIDWSELTERLRKSPKTALVPYTVNSFLAAVRMRLREDCEYRQNRQRCLTKVQSAPVDPEKFCEKRCKSHPEHVADAMCRDSTRPKRFGPLVLMLACIASDWHQINQRLSRLYPLIADELRNIGKEACPKWSNHLAALAKLHSRINLGVHRRRNPWTNADP